MVLSSVKSSFYLKITAVDSGKPVESLSTGSQEIFYSKYDIFKNFDAKISVVSKAGMADSELPATKVLVHLHSLNPHISLYLFVDLEWLIKKLLQCQNYSIWKCFLR